MTTATILSWVLAAAPESPTPPRADFDVADVEVSTGPNSTQLATFDADGDQSGEIVVWADADNQIRLDANFADGRYLSARVDSEGRMVDLESDSATEVADRLSEVGAFLHAEPPVSTAGRELWCVASFAAAVTCVGGNVLGCLVAGPGLVCNCMPLWEKGYTPPGCG
jgi:hypothetical protein